MPMARWFVDRLPQRGIPSVSLRRLLPEARFVGCSDWEVSGCTDDHRRLDPGQLFVAIRAARYDGHAYVREALDRGAAGVVVEQPCPEAGRLQVVVDDAQAAFARICQALAGEPSQHLMTLGVTGTLGKPLTSLFVRSILEAADLRCGLIGASGWSDGKSSRPLGASIGQAEGAWPGGAAGLASILSYMVEQKCAAGVIEVSCEALRSRAFEGVTFHSAVVTDVGPAGGFPIEQALQLRRAKSKLIRKIRGGGAAVVNADDPHAEILGGVNLDARRVSFGMERPTAVDVSARILRLDASGSRFLLHGFDQAATVDLRLIGPAAVRCALAAAALAWALEIDLDAVINGLEGVSSITGYVEAVNEGQEFDVRIDQAQTSEALVQALEAVRSISAGRVLCVVSAEGNQDRPTRRALAETAERLADRVFLTLGSPRSENADQILSDLLGGFGQPAAVHVEPDRRRAIEAALASACPGDSVMIAGKGRHSYQIFADRILPFDDFVTARQWLRARQGARSAVAAGKIERGFIQAS
jgi:UDP-N-acetylmuramoyl-L-alanyl-D-glutamate--2,6-diaminopimelate ligase